MSYRDLISEFMNKKDEVHSGGFGLFFGFMAGVVDPILLGIPFILVVGSLGGYALFDMLPQSDIVKKAVRKMLKSHYGVQIKDEIQYFAIMVLGGYGLGFFLKYLALIIF